jgi:hypothetical protein
VHAKLTNIESAIQMATARQNAFLEELGLPLLPTGIVGSTKAWNSAIITAVSASTLIMHAFRVCARMTSAGAYKRNKRNIRNK